MKIHEYQGKALLRKYGVPVPIGMPALNGFVPKPNTPLQWDAIVPEKELKRRIKYVAKGLSRISNVDVRLMSARIAHEQAQPRPRKSLS